MKDKLLKKLYWIKKVLRISKPIQVFHKVPYSSLEEQVRSRQEVYTKLIDSTRRNIEVFCHEPSQEWWGESKKEKQKRENIKLRFEKHEKRLMEKIQILDSLNLHNINYN